MKKTSSHIIRRTGECFEKRGQSEKQEHEFKARGQLLVWSSISKTRDIKIIKNINLIYFQTKFMRFNKKNIKKKKTVRRR